MKENHFYTDEQLDAYVENNYRNMTGLERELAQAILNDREVLRKLLEEVKPLAAQIIDPRDNVFSRMVKAIESRLQPTREATR